MDLEKAPLKNDLEHCKVIKLKDKVIMNNYHFRNQIEKHNMSNTFSSFHPAPMPHSHSRFKYKGRNAFKNKSSSNQIMQLEGIPAMTPVERKLAPNSISIMQNMSRNVSPFQNKTQINLFNLKENSVEDSNESIRHHHYNMFLKQKMNNTYDLGSSRIHPVNVEINKRMLGDDKSELTMIEQHNMSLKDIEEDDICMIWNQPYEHHSPNYNFDLMELHNKYLDVMENISLGEKSANILSLNASVSDRSIQSFLRNQHVSHNTIRMERSRGKSYY